MCNKSHKLILYKISLQCEVIYEENSVIILSISFDQNFNTLIRVTLSLNLTYLSQKEIMGTHAITLHILLLLKHILNFTKT